MAPQPNICFACGTQFPETETAWLACPICEDERQFVPASGQRFVTLRELRANCQNIIRQVDEGLHQIVTRPAFALGQRAHLVQTPNGNILWDCVALVDPDTVASIWAIGGISAIAISHPHYYTTMVEWSREFGNIPIHLHAADKEWVQRADGAVEFWEGETKELLPGVTMIRCGGHFAGGCVLHWARGAGVLLSSDVIQVAPNGRTVSFMYSHPNFIPLNAAAVEGIVKALQRYPFEAIHGGSGHAVEQGGWMVVRRSAERYLQAIR